MTSRTPLPLAILTVVVKVAFSASVTVIAFELVLLKTTATSSFVV